MPDDKANGGLDQAVGMPLLNQKTETLRKGHVLAETHVRGDGIHRLGSIGVPLI